MVFFGENVFRGITILRELEINLSVKDASNIQDLLEAQIEVYANSMGHSLLVISDWNMNLHSFLLRLNVDSLTLRTLNLGGGELRSVFLIYSSTVEVRLIIFGLFHSLLQEYLVWLLVTTDRAWIKGFGKNTPWQLLIAKALPWILQCNNSKLNTGRTSARRKRFWLDSQMRKRTKQAWSNYGYGTTKQIQEQGFRYEFLHIWSFWI